MSSARTILVFDTDATSREAIVEVLRAEDFGVLSTGDGVDAMELTEDCKVDLAIVEWASQAMDGLEIACRVKEQGGFVPVIWLSSMDEANVLGGFVRSTDGFLSRPVDGKRLSAQVRSLLAARDAFTRLVGQSADLLAITDGLTGLYNRRFLGERLAGELETCRQEGGQVALLAIDLDEFKRVNEEYGFKAGDELLQAVAGLLKRGLRTLDTVCRYGGDEFVAVLPQTDGVGASFAAERLRTLVENNAFDLLSVPGSEPVRITISLGVAVSNEVGHEAGRLLELADDALQAARTGGRNRVVWGGR